MHRLLCRFVDPRLVTFIYGVWYAALTIAVFFCWETDALNFYYLRH